MRSNHAAASRMQGFAFIVGAIAILAAVIHAYVGVRQLRQATDADGVPLISSRDALLQVSPPALAYAALGIGMAALLGGVSALLSRRTELPSRLIGTVDSVSVSIRELQTAVEHLPGSLSASIASSVPQQPVPIIYHQPAPAYEGASTTAAPEPQAPTPMVQATGFDPQNAGLLARMVELLEELRETSLLNETQRQERLQHHLTRRKANAIEQVQRHLADKQWRKASTLLEDLSRDFAADGEIVKLRSELEQRRTDAERSQIAETRQKVEGLMAVSSWDDAMRIMTDFMSAFPDSVEGQFLFDRVSRERSLVVETMAHRMYEEIKADTERRNWGRAYATAKRLIERFPEHQTAQRLKAQLDTLRENAEVQERKEQDDQIKQLVRSNRFVEAVELADQLIARWPDSKQAAALEEHMETLRTKAHREEAGTIVE